jgi:large subunit ribosomal protein L10
LVYPSLRLNIPEERRDTRLAINKKKKEQLLQGYLEMLRDAQGLIVAEYRGMNMKAINAVRAAARPVGGRFTVVKSTIFQIALRETGFPAPDSLLSGPIAVAVASSDLSKLTKTIMAIKDQPLLILKGAIMGETVFRADQLEVLSTLPTLDEARASLIGALVSPASQLVGLLTQPAQNLAATLKAYTDKLEGAAA